MTTHYKPFVAANLRNLAQASPLVGPSISPEVFSNVVSRTSTRIRVASMWKDVKLRSLYGVLEQRRWWYEGGA